VTEPTAPAPSPWAARARVAGRWGLRIGIALAGALVAVLLFGRISAPIGPFDASLAFRPTGGGAQVDVPPLGSLAVDVYDGPLRLDVDIQRVDQARAQALASDPVRLAGVVGRVSEDLQSAVVRLVWTTAGLALVGAAVTSLALWRRPWEAAIAAGLTTVMLAGTAGLGAATWRTEALSQPTYSGLLVNAQSLIGNAEDIVARFDAYRASLQDIVGNVGSLYATLSALPEPGGREDTVAFLHISDLHLNPAGFDLVGQVVEQFGVDAVLDTGDITDWGSQPENQLITSVGTYGVPYVYIRGNHDSAATARLISEQPNAVVLGGAATTVAGLVIAGIPDPRFTPDKTTGDDDASDEVLVNSGEALADVIEELPEPPAIAMVHDPKQAPPLDGEVPLVLAGHTHDRDVRELDDGTLLMVQGSTGGAGLRALEGEYPEPLTCTVLYLDPDTGRLIAYDEITVGGLGETEARIQRVVVPQATTDDADGSEETTEEGGTEDGTTDGSRSPASPTG
jgi:Calcineurin-like phosphoesterase